MGFDVRFSVLKTLVVDRRITTDYVGRVHEYLIQELARFGAKDDVRMIFWFNS